MNSRFASLALVALHTSACVGLFEEQGYGYADCSEFDAYLTIDDDEPASAGPSAERVMRILERHRTFSITGGVDFIPAPMDQFELTWERTRDPALDIQRSSGRLRWLDCPTGSVLAVPVAATVTYEADGQAVRWVGEGIVETTSKSPEDFAVDIALKADSADGLWVHDWRGQDDVAAYEATEDQDSFLRVSGWFSGGHVAAEASYTCGEDDASCMGIHLAHDWTAFAAE